MPKVPSVTEVALLLAPAEHETPWAREGPTRHALRRYLLIGCRWTRSWHRADAKAASLVNLARAERKVRLPSGWDSDSDLSQWLPDYDNPCPICGKPFVRTFRQQDCCGAKCMHRRAEIEEWNVRRVGQIGPPRCKFCNQYFEADSPIQQFCTARCQDHASKLDQVERADKAIADEIAAARRTAGLTQTQLARRAGIHERYLGSIEEGRVVVSGQVLDRIRQALKDAPTERLCRWCGGPIPPEKDPRAVFCTQQHAFDFHNAKKLKKNGHDHASQTNGSGPEHRSNGAGDPLGHHGDHSPAEIGPPGAADLDEQRMPA